MIYNLRYTIYDLPTVHKCLINKLVNHSGTYNPEPVTQIIHAENL